MKLWIRRSRGSAALLIAASVCLAGIGTGPALPVAEEVETSSCGTNERWIASGSPGTGGSTESLGGCPMLGSCDDPNVRNTNIPDSSDPVTTVTLQINVICNDAGTTCRATPTQVSNAMTLLKFDFEDFLHEGRDSRIRFLNFTRFINDSRYMTLSNFNLPNPDDFPMKDQYARSPETLLNVWVTDMDPNVSRLRGLSTYPWDPLALQPRGGIIVDFREFGANRAVLTHEIGHALGLYHTHRGGTTTEGEPHCGPCWESSHPLTSLAADFVGDFCKDTHATDPTFTCFPTGNFDTCGNSSFASNGWDSENFMGFGPLNAPCRVRYSPEQLGRMHCWLRDAVPGWISGQSDTCSGAGAILPQRNFGTTIGATSTPAIIESTCDNGNDDLVDIWYKYISAAGGPVTLSMCGTGTSFDSQVSVHTSCSSPIVNEVSCSEDRLNCGTFGAQARLTFQATAGQTYFIRVTSDSGGTGDFELLLCETGSAGCEPPPKIRKF